MPSKAFTKVQKSISKKRGSKPTTLHENSRDARRLQRASTRDGKIAKIKSEKERSYQSHLLRIAYAQIYVEESSLDSFSPDDILALTETYIRRNDDELEDLKASRRPGRPANPRFSELEHVKNAEETEFAKGFWMPDLKDQETLEKLKSWGGEWVSLGQMSFITVSRAGVVQKATFPPNKG